MPAVPTLVVVDSEAGGPVTATVSGSTAGTLNTLSYQSVDGELGGSTWTAAGNRIGDGTIAATVPIGYYWWKVASVAGLDAAVSNLVYQNVSDSAQAVQERVLAAVQAQIQALDLPNLEGGVIRQKVAFYDRMPYPSVLVTAYGQSETLIGGTNQLDHWGRPVMVVFCTRDAHTDETEPQLHYWREKVFRAFQSQRLPGVREAQICDVEPIQVAFIDETRTEYLESGFVLRFNCREPRGFGV